LESKTKAKDNSSKFTEEFVLSPGDLLYLPRGFWHEAETEPGSVSCHLTVGVLPTTYLDLLSAALAQAAKTDLGLRKQLPLGFATHTDAGEEVALTLADILNHLPAKIDAKAALSQIGSGFHRRYRDSLENSLLKPLQASELDKIGIGSWVHVRKGLVIGVDQTVTPEEFVFGSNGFQIDPSFVEACRFLCRQQYRFTPAMLPGDLTNEQKIILVKQLITENVLLPAEKEVRQAGSDRSRQSLSGWVPCNLRVANQSVRWVLLDETGMKDPFLFQTMRRRRAENPAYIRRTGLNALLQMKEDLSPSGFIFNVSRCGSTMLANALRSFKGSIVVSESEPISQLLLASTEEWKDADLQKSRNAALFRGLLRAYGQKRTAEERSLVIKFTSWNLLYIDEIRRLWPDVPCVILVRDPLEVAVSCIAKPPGWIRNQGILERFPIAALGVQGIDTPEAAYAQALGAFFKVIAKQADGLCHVMDYKDLNAMAITEIARFFKMPISIERDGESLNSALSTYSKDPSASSPFTADSERKRASASDLLRYEIERWAEPYYAEVRRATLADTFLVNQAST
jgi:Cupin superfamily protein